MRKDESRYGSKHADNEARVTGIRNSAWSAPASTSCPRDDGGLERLNCEQREGGTSPDPLAFRDWVISFVLQSTISSHSDDTTLVIPLDIRTVRITGDVNQVNAESHTALNSRSFYRIR